MSEAESFAPSGLCLRLVADPRLAPWAAFLRRFAASRMTFRDGFRLGAPSWVFGHDLLEAVKNGKSENVILSVDIDVRLQARNSADVGSK